MIRLSKPNIDKNDIKVVIKALKSGTISLGPKLNEFENKFAKYIGTRYAVGVNSGTSGLHLSVRALGIGEGDEVITTPFSFVASANCMLYEKAKPVFVDIEKETFGMNPDLIKDKINENTKAILPVHVFGQTCEISEIMKIAKKNKLKVIEDACEAIGATHKSKKAGTFGDASVFAFYPNKQMTTGEGGIIATNNEEVSKLCKSMANQGRSDNMQWLTHERLGYNYRLDEMSAALGVSQLKKIDFLLKKRAEIAKMYFEELNSVDGIILPNIKKGNKHTWFVFAVRTEKGINRDKLIKELKKSGVSSKAYFYPCIHLQPFYRKFGYKEGDFPIAEEISKTTLVLPMYIGMDIDTIKFIKGALIKCVSRLKR